MPTGEKYWYRRAWENGKESKWALGHWPEISLKQARELNYTMKHRAHDAPVILSRVAAEWWDARCAPVLARGTLRMKRHILDDCILPILGDRNVKDITPQDAIALLRGVQTSRGVYMGYRVKGVLSQIFQYAIAAGQCQWDPAQQVSGGLTPPPPARHRSVVQTEEHARRVLAVFNAYTQRPLARWGLLLLAYTFVRPGELLSSRWADIDMDKAEWRIPPNT